VDSLYDSSSGGRDVFIFLWEWVQFKWTINPRRLNLLRYFFNHVPKSQVTLSLKKVVRSNPDKE
jgi:hypothetical protein